MFSTLLPNRSAGLQPATILWRTLGHADVVIAISAYLVEQGMGEVNEVNFHLDSEGQVTAVAIESERKHQLVVHHAQLKKMQ